MVRVLVIGPGRIGSALAFWLLSSGRVSHLCLAGRSDRATSAIALDLSQAFPEANISGTSTLSVDGTFDFTFFSFSSLHWSPSVLVKGRSIEAPSNVATVDALARSLPASALGTIIVVSNPIDLITWYGKIRLDTDRIFGFGLSVDEVRMGAVASSLINTPLSRVQCVGEHGEHAVPLLSHLPQHPPLHEALYAKARARALEDNAEIVRCGHIPLYAPLRELTRLCSMLLFRESGVVSLSVHSLELPHEAGFGTIGLPIRVENGHLGNPEPFEANGIERRLFRQGVDSVRRQLRAFTRL